MTWMRNSTATMVPRDMRLKKLQLVIDEQSPMRIKPDSLIFPVKRKLQEYYVLLNHRQMLREWHTTRHTFHSEIGCPVCVASRGRSSPHRRVVVNKTADAEIPDRLHVHSNSGREQNSVRHFDAYGFLNPIIIQCDKEMSIIDVCRKVARERNARTVLRVAPKTSHQSNG